jgi:hypothetical protein
VLYVGCKPRLSKRDLKKMARIRFLRRRRDWRRKNWDKQMVETPNPAA